VKGSATVPKTAHLGVVCVVKELEFLRACDLPNGPVGAIGLLDLKKFGMANLCITLLIIEPCEFFKATVLAGAASFEVSIGLNVMLFEARLPADDML
jgi:hypothetical protein